MEGNILFPEIPKISNDLKNNYYINFRNDFYSTSSVK